MQIEQTKRAHVFIIFVCALLSFAACGEGSGPTEVASSFAVSLSSNTLTVTAGSSTTLTTTVTRTGNSTNVVSLSAEGLPAGVLATFASATIAPGATNTSLTVAVSAAAVPGTYTFTVRAKVAGLPDQTLTATATVLAQPAFAFTIPPAPGTVQAGANYQTVIQLTRTNFTEAVSLSAEGLPAGATAAFGAASLAGESTSLTISTTVAAVPGVYTVTVRAKSSLSDRTAAFTFTINAPPDFGISTTVSQVSVQQGVTSAPVVVNIARSGGFTGAVALTLEGTPSGVNGTIALGSVPGASTHVTFTAAQGATVGTVTVTIRGRVPGLPDRSATIAVTVTPDPGSFALAFGASTLSAAQAQTGSATVTVTRTAPFTGPVSLSVSGVPAGTAATFSAPTIAAGASTSTLTLATTSTTVPGTYQLTVRATANGVADKTAILSFTVTAVPFSLIAQHVIAQEGLAIALASTVLQSQLEILFAVTTRGSGSATACKQMIGGGSIQSLPIGADDPTKAGIYYDTNCTKPYILADVTALNVVAGRAELTETATYYALNGGLLGVMTLKESADITGSLKFVAGLGTFTPANGAEPVRLGLTCVLEGSSITETIPCYGGIEQYVPSIGRSVGSVTVLGLHLNEDPNSSLTFDGNNATLLTGARGTLTLSLNTATALAISGGTVWGSSTQQGMAGSFSLFPPTPTGWSVTDTAHDMKFGIDVVSNTVRNSVGRITQISTGAVLATIAVDQSGTGTITWSDGSTVAVTSWLFAN